MGKGVDCHFLGNPPPPEFEGTKLGKDLVSEYASKCVSFIAINCIVYCRWNINNDTCIGQDEVATLELQFSQETKNN